MTNDGDSTFLVSLCTQSRRHTKRLCECVTEEKGLKFIFDHVFAFSKYLFKAWDRRRRVTYK